MQNVLRIGMALLVLWLPVYSSIAAPVPENQIEPEPRLTVEAFFVPPTPSLGPVVVGVSRADEKEAALQAEQAKIAAEKARQAALKPTQRPQRATPTPTVDLSDLQATAREMVALRWPGEAQWIAFDRLVKAESGWNTKALNKSSGACGLPQALPCSKLPQGISTSAEGQLTWMLNYVAARYGSPVGAWAFWQQKHWY